MPPPIKKDSPLDPFYDTLLNIYQNIPGPGMLPVRKAQIDQFMHPDKDVFPQTTDRPQSLTKFQDRKFRSMRDYYPQYIKIPEKYQGLSPSKLPESLDNFRSDAINTGLGASTWSMGKDDKGTYISNFDSWDFDEPGSDGGGVPGMRDFLNRKGTPFNVYDKFYLDSDTIGPTIRTRGKGDIELPSSKLDIGPSGMKKGK